MFDRSWFKPLTHSVKAASRRSFSVWRKYDRFPNLIMAYVWGIGGEVEAETYALTQAEVLAIAEAMRWTKTTSWIDKGGYSTTNPSAQLLDLLKPYRMTPEKWRTKLPEIR